MRELGLWEGSEGLDMVYQDIASLASSCSFRDCRHENEPNCAVLEALEIGELDEGRLKGFRKLQWELEGEEMRKSKYATRQHYRQRGRHIRKTQKVQRQVTGKY
jgi:ribosome biogenesis GTPase